MLGLHIVQYIVDALARQEQHCIGRGFVLELIAVHLPREDYHALFDSLIDWARYFNLFAYDEAAMMIAVRHEQQTRRMSATGARHGRRCDHGPPAT